MQLAFNPKKLKIGIWTLAIVALLVAAKYVLHAWGFEFFR